MQIKLIRKATLILTITSFALLFSSTKAFACTIPSPVGTLSTGRDAVEVGWTVSTISDITEFKVAYVKAGESTYSPFEIVPTSFGTTDYSHTFTGLDPNTIYYWKLRTVCDPTTDINSDQLMGFLTVPTLDITGFLLVDGQIHLSRRIAVQSDFSYLIDPIFSVLTESVGSGRLHVISID